MKLSKRAFIRLLTLGGSLIPGIAALAAEEAATSTPIGKARVLQGPMLGAVTTVLGVAPLVQDIFWVAMSVTIMAGLTFGTILTMVIVPVFYTIFYRISSPKQA